MMFGRGESKQSCSRGLSQRLKEDMISSLPDPLISQILSHLPTKEAVCTSVLSTRWKSLWLWVPELDLDFYQFPDFNAFVSFGHRVFDSNRVSFIRKVKLDVEDGVNADESYNLKSWIDSAVNRKIQHLDVRSPEVDYFYQMPISLYICETLVFLKIQWVSLPDAELFFSLPCLKTMHLIKVQYPNEAALETLVSSCPVLEELEISLARNDAELLRVQSRSLKSLTFIRVSPFQFQSDSVSGVVVDAPLLRFLSIYDYESDSFHVNNLESNIAKLEIVVNFGLEPFDEASVSARRRRCRIRSFLPGILRVRDMKIDAGTFKVIHEYTKLEPRPQFRCMSRLFVTICVSDLKCLPTFLESCPNLKSLVLAIDDYGEMSCEEMDQISGYSSVPECFLQSLEFVDFVTPISGYAAEMKLVKYFLENSAVLKTLTLHVNHDGSIDYEKLLKIPRGSSTCQVVLI
ncbi:unnamed protein product [Thlaspi arvense]|uniref:F-box domain-containing protein n=1 Tax=Thlaspi arvense TaxID=13288 RepID=A0AAU9R6Z8_THLAR|nr:unnamed protein product [Thlaspi arvense]